MSIKHFLILLFSSLGFVIVAQDTLLYETFQSGTLNDFVSVDVDGLPLSEDFEGFEGGFEVLPIAGANDFRALGVSSFRDGGTANNLLISPSIAVTKTLTFLQWEASSLSGDPSQAESYEVVLSTTGTDVADFTDVLISITAETNSTREIDLSFYEGSTVYIAFRQNGTDKFALTLDNILVTQPSSEVEVDLLELVGDRYMDITTLGRGVELLVFNAGAQVITELLVELDLGNGNPVQLTIDSLNIEPQSEGMVSIGLNDPDPNKYLVTATVISANGVSQDTPSHSRTFFFYENGPNATQIMEVATSTTCGWCPGANVDRQLAAADNPNNLITLAAHIDDALVAPVYAFGTENQPTYAGLPSAIYNRSAGGLTSEYPEILEEGRSTSPVSIEVTNIYDPVSRELVIDLTGTAFTRFDAEDIRFSVLIVEDSITSATDLLDQANNYSANSQNVPLVGPDGRDWQASPDPVPGSELFYSDVVRDVVGGFDGIIGSIDATGVGEAFSHQVNYILPSVFDETQVSIVVLVLDGSESLVLQANEQILDIVSSVADHLKRNFNVYPNPALSSFTIENKEAKPLTAYQLIDGYGQIVLQQNQLQVSENQDIRVDCEMLEGGIYTLRVSEGTNWDYRRIIVIGSPQ